MEVITKVIHHARPDKFLLYAIGDIHTGSIHCADEDIRTKLAEIQATPNAYFVGMGDYADCITTHDPRFMSGGLASWVRPDDIVDSQRNYLRDLFKPVADKCLCLLTGNHEEAIHKAHDDDIGRHLAEDLGVPYGGYSSFLELLFRRGNAPGKSDAFRLVVHLWHGAGASQTEGARIMRLMRLVNDIEADIYLMGHLHAIAVYTPDRLVLSTKTKRVRSTKLAAVVTGSWLKTYTQPHDGESMSISYGEMKGYKPSRIGCPCIEIDPDAKDFRVIA